MEGAETRVSRNSSELEGGEQYAHDVYRLSSRNRYIHQRVLLPHVSVSSQDDLPRYPLRQQVPILEPLTQALDELLVDLSGGGELRALVVGRDGGRAVVELLANLQIGKAR
jgi:hypothetical protein